MTRFALAGIVGGRAASGEGFPANTLDPDPERSIAPSPDIWIACRLVYLVDIDEFISSDEALNEDA